MTLQQNLRDRQPEIGKTPSLANGGRILHVLNPEEIGWGTLREIAEQDGIIGFPLVQAEQTIAQIKEHLGARWETPKWLVYRGARAQVLKACSEVQFAATLPEGWQVAHHITPSDQVITEVQELNLNTGVAPYPAYYMKSEAVPVLTSFIRDDLGSVVATASVADRYHPQGRLAGHVFAGMVSVGATYRGRGLGKLINALALIESAERFNWEVATEHVAADNPASRAMIAACGLDEAEGLRSVIAMRPGEVFTR
ncbi:hypothetical protein ROA7450_02936 [Roseovarius albus]|uniref:N-acetyltransferase domain-containing protein n=2 Tax=Roseovarius albus TaxID=1247867 RepID=A0A1X6ZN58_9RHOB|nr:hypothetical protein ROA7450_02936 [Roseovarius albus]